MAAADPATTASFSRVSFRGAVRPSPFRLPLSRAHPPGRLRVSSTVVALHKRNPKRLKYAAERQFKVLSASSASSSFFSQSHATTLAFRGLSAFLELTAMRDTKREDTRMLRVKVEPSGEDFWKLDPVIELINRGAVGVIPTDTVYAVLLHFAFFFSFVNYTYLPIFCYSSTVAAATMSAFADNFYAHALLHVLCFGVALVSLNLSLGKIAR